MKIRSVKKTVGMVIELDNEEVDDLYRWYSSELWHTDTASLELGKTMPKFLGEMVSEMYKDAHG